MENSIEEAIKTMKHWIEYEKANKEKINRADELINIQETILSEYKRLQEEFKQVDHECERLEEKEVRLIKENEYYKDLINALEIYYNITEEDLEKCIKEDR